MMRRLALPTIVATMAMLAMLAGGCAATPKNGTTAAAVAPRACPGTCAAAAGMTPAPRHGAAGAKVLFIVDQSAYEALKPGLATYAAHVKKLTGVTCEARPDGYYALPPAKIRGILQAEYEKARTSDCPLIGAIMVGPIPYACRSHNPKEIMTPCPLYYEDFDAVYEDKNGDGAYSDEEITNNRLVNPTEIWVSWWIPPSLERGEQARMLQSYLDKLDRYYRGEIVGRDQMLWAAGNVVKVEDVEAWTVLLKDTMQPLKQQLRVWSKIGQDEGTFRPSKRKDEHSPSDFQRAFTLQPWQHVHVIAHGNQRGWYWDTSGVSVARCADGNAEWSLLLDLNQFNGTAANIITTSGCSNGNFRGDYTRECYDRALPNLLLFSTHTNTIAYYGAASPQSTSGFACMVTELVESLKSDGNSFLGEGYYKMRNSDYAWGLQHYFFRGGDEKVLLGDPFARYRDSKDFPPEQKKAIQEKIDAANWVVVGQG